MIEAKEKDHGTSLALRIFFLPLIVLVLLIGIAYSSLERLNLVKKEIDNVALYWLPANVLADKISDSALKQRVLYERVLKLYEIAPLPREELSRELRLWSEGNAHVGVLMNRADGMFGDDARLNSALTLVEEVYLAFSGRATTVMDFLGEGKRIEAESIRTALNRDEAKFEEVIEKVESVFEQSFEQAMGKAQEHELGVLKLNAMITIVGAVFGVLFAALLTARITAPLRRLMVTMRAVQKGDLDQPLDVTTNDEIGSLTRSFNAMVTQLKLRDTIESTFGKYVDARIVQRLIDRPDAFATDGENQVMTVLFGDVVGFAGAMKSLSAEVQVELTNQHLTRMSSPIVDHYGVIDKYIDTMVMAFWGIPFVPENDHAHLACSAALQQVGQLDILRQTVTEKVGQPPEYFSLQIGMATGSLVAGNMGSERAKSFTVMGDTVNIASRLKGANKAYGTRILISEQTHLMIVDTMETREIDLISVVGKDEPLRIYELIGEKGKLDADSIELRNSFHEGLAAYRRQEWGEAIVCFKRCAGIRPDDGPTRTYLERVDMLQKHPKSPDWDGVWHLTQK